MKLVSKVRKLTVIIMVFVASIIFSSVCIYSTSAATQSKDSTVDIQMIPGDLEFTSVPSFHFSVDNLESYYHINTMKIKPIQPLPYFYYFQEQGTVNGNFIIEDNRLTGKNWSLRLSLSNFVNTSDPAQILNGVEMTIDAPVPVFNIDSSSDFQGYPVTLIAGSNMFSTLAVSKTKTTQISHWEGHIPSAFITIPNDFRVKKAESTFKADIVWSIEDTP